MPLAICIAANDRTGSAITSLWDDVARLEQRPSMRDLAYPPHVTLAVYDGLDEALLRSTLERAFSGCSPLRLTFEAVRSFEGDPLVLWAAPARSAELGALHAVIHGLIGADRCHRHYRPGVWIPHCTLGTQIRAECREAALALVERTIVPFEVVFDRADAVAFAPVTILRRQVLA